MVPRPVGGEQDDELRRVLAGRVEPEREQLAGQVRERLVFRAGPLARVIARRVRWHAGTVAVVVQAAQAAAVARRSQPATVQSRGQRFLEWSVAGEDVSPRMVKRANPGSSITLESIRLAREGLPDLAYRRFVANQSTDIAGHWLPPGAWQKCITAPVIADGEPVTIGVDVGGQRSATAVAWATDDLRVGVEITARRADRRDGRTGGSGFLRAPRRDADARIPRPRTASRSRSCSRSRGASLAVRQDRRHPPGPRSFAGDPSRPRGTHGEHQGALCRLIPHPDLLVGREKSGDRGCLALFIK